MEEIGWMAFILFWLRVVVALVLLSLVLQVGWIVGLVLAGLAGYMLYGLWRDFKNWKDS